MAILSETYRYKLDPGSKKFSCPNCGKKRFVRYIDSETDQYLESGIGRCDREQNCQYHKKPGKVQSNIGRVSYTLPKPKPKSDFLSIEMVNQTLNRYEKNTLISWMATLPGWNMEKAADTARSYNVGTGAGDVDGWAIFWQVDNKKRVRSGKLIKYDSTGHRVKDGYAYDWIHQRLKKKKQIQRYNLDQCLFGLHLLDDRPIAIVESEKTALIASMYFPGLTWMASGQLNGISKQKMRPLTGHAIVFFPDAGAYQQWWSIADKLKHIGNIRVSKLLEEKAAHQEKGYDLADYLIQHPLREVNPWTKEIFDERGYPADWDEV